MFSGKTLAVIGASYLQLPLVLKARELGMRTLCFAWEEGAVCRDFADRFFPVSILEKEKIARLCRQENIDAVTTIASDAAVPTVNFVAANLHLPGNSIHSGKLATDKYAMRQALQAAGVHVPAFAVFRSPAEAAAAAEQLQYPVIVKPVDRSGSLEVRGITHPSQLAEAAKLALAASFQHTGIVEQWVDFKQEISVEGISHQGEYHLLAVTNKVTTGAPRYVELGHHQPADLSPEIMELIRQQVRLGAEALQITSGASHAELMLTDDGNVFVTEIGARMGGDFIGSDLVQLSTGYDYLQGVIECALGQFSGVTFSRQNAAGVWFYTRHTPEVEKLLRERPRFIVRGETDDSAELPELTCSGDRSGYIIYQTAPDDPELPRLRDITFAAGK